MLSNRPSLGFFTVLRFNFAVIAVGLLMSVTAFAAGSISGTIYYPLGGTVTMGNASVCASQGGSSWCQTTGTNGQFTLTGFPSTGTITVSVTKTAETAGGTSHINSADNARLAQHLNGSNPFTTDIQRVTADVTQNGTVSSFDQSKLAGWIVNLNNDPYTGYFLFFTTASGNPSFPVGSSPTTYTYTNVTNDVGGADFNGILVGDVDGSWTN